MSIHPPMGVSPLPARIAGDEQPLHPGFWQHRFAQNVLPFLTSLILHLAIVIVGLATYGVVRHLSTPRVLARLQETPAVGGYEIGTVTQLPIGTRGENHKSIQTDLPDVPADAQGWSNHRLDPTQLLSATGGGPASEAAMIGLGAGSAFSSGGVNGPGTDGPGAINGPPAEFGLGFHPGGGITKGIFNIPGNTNQLHQRVVFVCDASGSMMQKFDELRTQLRKAIDPLRPNDSFNVVFFQDTSAAVADPSGLLLGTPSNKRKVLDFIDKIAPRSSTDPLPGLADAFKLKPSVVWLLTDGDFPDNKAVLKFIRENNHTGAVIHTIAYMDDGAEYQKVLQTIATENRGTFKFVGANEVEGK